jgi:hypothetical protein
VAGWLGVEQISEHRQPLAHGCGFVVDDVVDRRAVVLEREHGRGGCVVEVDPGEDATAVADDRELPLAYRLEQPVVGGAVEGAVTKQDPAPVRDRLLEMEYRDADLAHPFHRGGVERIILGLDRPALARVPTVGRDALSDEAAHARFACGGEQVVGAFSAQPVGLGESAIEVSAEAHIRHRGGYCYEIEDSIGGCRQTAGDRDLRGRGQFGVTYREKQPVGTLPVVTRITGDIETPKAAVVTVHYADGTSSDVPFIWVSQPIAAGFFSLDIPTSHWNTKQRVVSVTLQAADGSRLGIQTFPAEHRRPRPHPPGNHPSRLSGPVGRILPPTPPTAPSAPLQNGTADGFAVIAGHNGEVQFTELNNTPALQRLAGHSVSYSCFRLTREFGIFTVRGLGNEARFAPKVGIDVNGVGTPFDGCDIEGSAGHLWPDTEGSHSVVEIAFTAAGRAFFANRAAARDLALFVRSRRVHQIRKEPPDQALRDLHTAYGTQLADSKIHINEHATNELVFSETSTTGKTFSVTVRNGKIVKQNLKPYAFAF